jgi:hypothetical protein
MTQGKGRAEASAAVIKNDFSGNLDAAFFVIVVA